MQSKQSIEIGKNNHQPGFTIIEVLIALAIFAVGILAVGSMQISAINTNAGARNSTTLVTMAKDRVEELMALDYDDAPELAAGEHSVAAGSFTQDTDGIDNDEDGQIDEDGEAGHVRIEWNVAVSDLTGDGVDDSKIVSVTVTRQVGGSQRRASLDFVKADM